MKSRHIQAVTQRLTLEIGFASDMGPAGLAEAIIEALGKGGVLEEAGIIYIKSEAPGHQLFAVDLWAPEPEEAGEVEPPMLPTVDLGADEPEEQPNI